MTRTQDTRSLGDAYAALAATNFDELDRALRDLRAAVTMYRSERNSRIRRRNAEAIDRDIAYSLALIDAYEQKRNAEEER